MRCPKCGFRDDKVIDSRQSRDSSSIRRRRVCLQCAYRFTTYEQIERSDLRVIKRDRTHEPFDRRKLVNSLAKACEKRSISLVTLETAADEIVHELETSGREVSSATIGTKVMEKLREIGEGADDHGRGENPFFPVTGKCQAGGALESASETGPLLFEIDRQHGNLAVLGPGAPPGFVSLLEIAQEAGAGYELAFFDGLEKRI